MLSLGILRRWGAWKWAAVCVVVMVVSAHAEPMGLEVTKESKEEFDIEKEVVAFYKDLIVKNPKVADRHEKLVATGNEDNAEDTRGVEATDDIHSIQWLVESDSWTTGNAEDRRRIDDDESVYLVVQQLMQPFHHGYEVKKNIVAKIRVIYHLERLPKGDDDPGYAIMVTNKLTLKFEGFVEVRLKEEM